MSEKPEKPKEAKPKGGPEKGGAPRAKGQAPPARVSAITVSDGKETKHAVPRLKKFFQETVVPQMMGPDGNPYAVPRLEKIVINIGVTDAKDNVQMLDAAREELALIAGQWPQVRRSKKSISNFKLRQGMPIGLRVTLRGDRMYEFLDRLISTAIPRIRDFRGLESSFDGTGNYNLGLREQMLFPEVSAERVLHQRGMNITVVTSADDDARAAELLRNLGLPFKKDAKPAASAAAGA